MIRIVIADDEALFREGIATLVAAADDLDVVDLVANGREAVEAVRAHRPDVVLLDMQMPVMDGIEATRQIRSTAPQTRIVILTAFRQDRYLLPALREGASGYLLKDSSITELHHGIRAAAAGESILSPAVTTRVLETLRPAMNVDRIEAHQKVEALSERERAVLALVARGMSNGAIGRELFMAEPTVKTHLTHAMTKLGVTNRTQAAILAHDAGLGADDETVTE